MAVLRQGSMIHNIFNYNLEEKQKEFYKEHGFYPHDRINEAQEEE